MSGWRRSYSPVQDPSHDDSDSSDAQGLLAPPSSSRQSSFATYAKKLPPIIRRPPPDDLTVDYHPFSLFIIRLIPLVAFFAWLATLLGLLAMWLWLDGRAKYKW